MSCPFHPDRTPSASVNHELDAFACFSCSRHGDALKLLQTELNLSFGEALDKARQLLGEDVEAGRQNGRTRRVSELLRRELGQ
jgi:DNA primase